MAKKKIRKNIGKAIAHVNATFNNTMVTITDLNGETLCWDSAGTVGFKGARKATPFAATRAATGGLQGQAHGRPGSRGSCEGSRLRSRIRDHRSQFLGAAGHRGRRSHADPPQRLPPEKAAPRLTIRIWMAWKEGPVGASAGADHDR